MTVRVYRSTDASAPVLTGAVGSLTALLDAVLVNGYGALTAAGWTINQTTTNKRGYKQNVTGANNSSGMLLYVDDTGPGAGGAREARACGFETMSAITPTGTGQFPTSAQSAIGVGTTVIRKSNTADATARAWTIVANGQTVYVFIETGDQAAPIGVTTFIFGDFKPYKSGDQYAVAIVGRMLENSNTGQNDPMQMIGNQNASITGRNDKMFGHFLARSWTGLGGSVQFGKTIDYGIIGGGTSGNAITMQRATDTETQVGGNSNINFTMGRNASSVQFPTPNGPDGGLWLSPLRIFHNYSMRGYFPGLWGPLHDRAFVHNDTLTIASGGLSGKTLLAQQFMAYIGAGAGTTDYGQVLVETSDTWT